MTYKNDGVLNRAAQATYGLDRNGALRKATGLNLDINGICRTLWGKEKGQCHDEMLATFNATNDLHVTGSFEDGLGAVWTTASANLTLAHDTTVGFYGTDSASVTRINTNGVGSLYTGTGTAAKTAVSVGERIYSHVMVRHNSAGNQTMLLRHRHYAGNTLVADDSAVEVTVLPNTWTALSHSAVTPATTDGMQFAIISSSIFTINEKFWVDGLTVGRYPRTAFKPGSSG